MADAKRLIRKEIMHLLHNASYATHSKGLNNPYLSIDFRDSQHNSGYLKNFVSAGQDGRELPRLDAAFLPPPIRKENPMKWQSNDLARACREYREPNDGEDLPYWLKAGIIALVVLLFAALLYGSAAWEGIQ